MARPDDEASTKRLLTKADGGVAGVAVAAVAGATVLGLNAKTNVAAILAFTAAIFVALLTAYWTQRRLNQELSAAKTRLAEQLAAETTRQAQQLAAEQKRLELQLAHERARLDAQLEHERNQTDVADLRATLGESLAAANRARQATVDGLLDSAKHVAATSALVEMETQLDRMHIRLGKQDPIVKAFTQMGNAAWAIHRMGTPTYPMTHDELIKLPSMLEWGKAYHEYVELAQSRIGSRDNSP